MPPTHSIARTLREGIIMKRTQLLVLSVLALGLQGAVQASPFPADAEASYDKAALASYAEQHAGGNWTSAGSTFPADAEASYDKPALGSYAERHSNDMRAVLEMPVLEVANVNIDD
jgi:hypothetical protein